MTLKGIFVEESITLHKMFLKNVLFTIEKE